MSGAREAIASKVMPLCDKWGPPAASGRAATDVQKSRQIFAVRHEAVHGGKVVFGGDRGCVGQLRWVEAANELFAIEHFTAQASGILTHMRDREVNLCVIKQRLDCMLAERNGLDGDARRVLGEVLNEDRHKQRFGGRSCPAGKSGFLRGIEVSRHNQCASNLNQQGCKPS